MAHMNGFADHGLDEDAFGPKSGLETFKSFDAFPKTKSTYTSASTRGGQWTVIFFGICTFLVCSEFWTWIRGTETHHFSVERGVSHELQLNMDIVVAMQCSDLHINVQDAAGDRILAGDLLKRDETSWQLWSDYLKRSRRGGLDYMALNEDDQERKHAEEEDQHVGHVLYHMRDNKRKFPKGPKLRRFDARDACRIYGSLEGNKVQGDWHITARGHGYAEVGAAHLDHAKFNFSHYITELSFGPHYPSLLNPLDKTINTTPDNFYKYQYYLSIVPTIFTRRRVSSSSGTLDPRLIPQPPTLDSGHGTPKGTKHDSNTIFTNQYAATSQSHPVSTNTIPGIFFKYDIEPILLVVTEHRSGFLSLLVRLVNVVSGVMVGGGWLYQLTEWAREVYGKRKRSSEGMLHGRRPSLDEKYRH